MCKDGGDEVSSGLKTNKNVNIANNDSASHISATPLFSHPMKEIAGHSAAEVKTEAVRVDGDITTSMRKFKRVSRNVGSTSKQRPNPKRIVDTDGMGAKRKNDQVDMMIVDVTTPSRKKGRSAAHFATVLPVSEVETAGQSHPDPRIA